MKKLYEVTAWRPETYTTSDTFEAETPEQALGMAKAAFADEIGESCGSCEAWNEFMVSLAGQQVLVDNPPDHTGELLETLKMIESMADMVGDGQIAAKARAAIAKATGQDETVEKGAETC